MTVIYPVIYTRTGDKDDTYLVSIPDIDGATEGYGLKDAVAMARDYIANYIVTSGDENIPSASSINAINPQKGCFADAGDSFVSLIDVDLDRYMTVSQTAANSKPCGYCVPGYLDILPLSSPSPSP